MATFSVYTTTSATSANTMLASHVGPASAVSSFVLLCRSRQWHHVWVVCDQDDTTTLDWTIEDGLVFPRQGDPEYDWFIQAIGQEGVSNV